MCEDCQPGTFTDTEGTPLCFALWSMMMIDRTKQAESPPRRLLLPSSQDQPSARDARAENTRTRPRAQAAISAVWESLLPVLGSPPASGAPQARPARFRELRVQLAASSALWAGFSSTTPIRAPHARQESTARKHRPRPVRKTRVPLAASERTALPTAFPLATRASRVPPARLGQSLALEAKAAARLLRRGTSARAGVVLFGAAPPVATRTRQGSLTANCAPREPLAAATSAPSWRSRLVFPVLRGGFPRRRACRLARSATSAPSESLATLLEPQRPRCAKTGELSLKRISSSEGVKTNEHTYDVVASREHTPMPRARSSASSVMWEPRARVAPRPVFPARSASTATRQVLRSAYSAPRAGLALPRERLVLKGARSAQGGGTRAEKARRFVSSAPRASMARATRSRTRPTARRAPRGGVSFDHGEECFKAEQQSERLDRLALAP